MLGLYEISQLNLQVRIEPFALDNEIFAIQPTRLPDHTSSSLIVDIPLPFEQNNSSRKKSSGTGDRKRKQDSGGIGGVDETNKKKTKGGGKKKATIKDEYKQFLLPHILQPILQRIFDEFWKIELEPEIAYPFFSTITRDNCVHFGMPDFYDVVAVECTLADIKV